MIAPLLLALAAVCAPTPSDPVPPYYRPGAPVRSVVGRGFVLTGTIRAAQTCRPLPHARVEFFLANADGVYDDAHRGTTFASASGAYRITSNFPGRFHSIPPHIHLRVSAAGFAAVVTEYRPRIGTTRGAYDVRVPRRSGATAR